MWCSLLIARVAIWFSAAEVALQHVSEALPEDPATRQVEREIERYIPSCRQFRKLSQGNV